MDRELTFKQNFVYLKVLVQMGIIECKHEIGYDDFCLICKKNIYQNE